jgi:hypothetical protein
VAELLVGACSATRPWSSTTIWSTWSSPSGWRVMNRTVRPSGGLEQVGGQRLAGLWVEVRRLVIDPAADTVTHLVVQSGHRREDARLRGQIGRVQGFLVGPGDHRVSHVLLQESHFGGAKKSPSRSVPEWG